MFSSETSRLGKGQLFVMFHHRRYWSVGVGVSFGGGVGGSVVVWCVLSFSFVMFLLFCLPLKTDHRNDASFGRPTNFTRLLERHRAQRRWQKHVQKQ